MIMKISYLALIVTCICLALSCSSELDFDQVDDVVLAPQIDADILFFTLGTEDFIDTSITDETVVVRDTTRLEFLNDSFIRDSVEDIELTFQIDNSFLQSFNNRFIFINEINEPQYTLEFNVDASLDGTTTRTSIVEQVNEDELQAILSSIKVVNELQLNTNEALINGEISFQSKALYSLEINDF